MGKRNERRNNKPDNGNRFYCLGLWVYNFSNFYPKIVSFYGCFIIGSSKPYIITGSSSKHGNPEQNTENLKLELYV